MASSSALSPFLLLHGGGGPQTVAGFADLLASLPARVVTPVHPGFGGTARPDDLTRPGQLAVAYDELLKDLDLDGVTVVGNSLGGWIAAEMALLSSPRVAEVILVDAVGVEVPGHPIADFFALSLPEIAQHSYYEPDKFQIDPAALPAMAGNRAALTVYSGNGRMFDPGLRERLAGVTTPVRVIWGEADRIADPGYGRALAAAIPGASFTLLDKTGHLPQIETPERLLKAVARP
ncbi:alpha/beta fold hydrolase [Actinoplanes sp. CA-131856]